MQGNYFLFLNRHIVKLSKNNYHFREKKIKRLKLLKDIIDKECTP